MKHCPITYDIISDQTNYSARGLKLLSPQLKNLYPLALSAKEQRNCLASIIISHQRQLFLPTL